MIIFPGYLPHEFTFDYGIEPLDLYIGICNMLKTFDKKKYKIIKKAVSKEMASFLTDYYFLKQHVAAKLFLDGYITADRREGELGLILRIKILTVVMEIYLLKHYYLVCCL